MEKLIIVTGFDVFRGHEEKNASWEAVQLLPNILEHKDVNYKIVKKKVEVKYNDVDQQVDEIWSQDVALVIHVGVHGGAAKIHLEKCAVNGFPGEDFSCAKLKDPMICLKNSGKCEILETKINVDKITKTLNETYKDMFLTSCDVGSYLCGYLYLKSIDMNSERSLFVHVPPTNIFTTDETSRAILKIIEQCLSEIMNV